MELEDGEGVLTVLTVNCEGGGAPGVCRSPRSDYSAGASCPLLPSSVPSVRRWREVLKMIKLTTQHPSHLTPHLATSVSTVRPGRPTGVTWQPAHLTASSWAPGATPATSPPPAPSTGPGTGGLSYIVLRTMPGAGKYLLTSPGSSPKN